MMKYRNMLLMIVVLVFTKCNMNEGDKEVFVYNSEKCNQKVAGFNISLADASKNAAAFWFEKKPEINEFKLRFSIVYNNYYVFPVNAAYYNLKTTDYYLKGIWVNGVTGEVIYNETKQYVNVFLDPASDCYYFTKFNRCDIEGDN